MSGDVTHVNQDSRHWRHPGQPGHLILTAGNVGCMTAAAGSANSAKKIGEFRRRWSKVQNGVIVLTVAQIAITDKRQI